MSHPIAYAPEMGYRYQILCRNPAFGRSFDHCDYAVDRAERVKLVTEYRMAYGPGFEFKTILLPAKYWPAPAVKTV